jgi:hypothetical protein
MEGISTLHKLDTLELTCNFITELKDVDRALRAPTTQHTRGPYGSTACIQSRSPSGLAGVLCVGHSSARARYSSTPPKPTPLNLPQPRAVATQRLSGGGSESTLGALCMHRQLTR